MRILGVFFILMVSPAVADEEVQNEKINKNAIPPVITVKDAKLELTAEEQLILLNRRKADYILKDMRISGKSVPSQYDKKLEDLRRKKFDENPRQTIPIKECIKPNNVIDNEVYECMNGRRSKTW